MRLLCTNSLKSFLESGRRSLNLKWTDAQLARWDTSSVLPSNTQHLHPSPPHTWIVPSFVFNSTKTICNYQGIILWSIYMTFSHVGWLLPNNESRPSWPCWPANQLNYSQIAIMHAFSSDGPCHLHRYVMHLRPVYSYYQWCIQLRNRGGYCIIDGWLVRLCSVFGEASTGWFIEDLALLRRITTAWEHESKAKRVAWLAYNY